jgi:hypothetical protein
MSANTAVREKLLGFLAAKVPQTTAAAAAGVSDAYVSQLMREPDFLAELAARSAGSLEADIKHDSTIESVEAKALETLEKKLPFVRSALEAGRIFQILNSAKKRATIDPASAGLAGAARTVTIVLPAASRPGLKFNSDNQVIEVEGRVMAPLPSRELPNLAKQADEERAAAFLSTVAPLNTVIGGVVKVL